MNTVKDSERTPATIKPGLKESFGEFLNSELKELMQRIDKIEGRMVRRESPGRSIQEKREKSAERALRKCEKELKSLESSVSRGSERSDARSEGGGCESLRRKLVRMRQQNLEAKKENERLRKSAKTQIEAGKKVKMLREECKSLISSLKRSENIRRKQKKVIEQLKCEIDKAKHKRKSSKSIVRNKY